MQQAPFEFVDHTADYALLARGRDFPDLVANAARGFITLLADTEGLSPDEFQEIEVQGDSREQVLVHALKELLYLEEEGRLPVVCRVEHADAATARLRVGTARLDRVRERLRTAVKAVTYHGVDVVEGPTGLSVRLVFDT